MMIMSQLGTLESAGLIRLAQVEPDLEYLFRHVLVQDAAYASLLDADRKRLHRAVGEAVETLYADRLASHEYSALLARHFQEAGEASRALEYYAQAGTAALASYANPEAETLYEGALALPCSEAQRAVLSAGLAEALFRQSRFDEALQTWQKAIRIHQNLGDDDGVARLYARSARAVWYADDTPEGLRLCQEGLRALGVPVPPEGNADLPDSPDMARLLHEAARAYHFNGLPEQASPLCQLALEMAERHGAVDVQADALTTMAILPHQPADQVLAALRKAVELSEAAGLLEIAGRAHHNLGVMTATFQGDLLSSRDHLLRAVELARQRGTISEAITSWTAATGHALALGELETVERSLTEIEAMVATLPDPATASLELQAMQAGLLSMKGAWEESLRLFRLCRAKARERGNLQFVVSTNNELVGVLLELDWYGELDDWGEAEAAQEEAIRLSERGLSGEVWPLCQLGIVRARQGRFEETRHLLAEAKEKARVHPSAWDQQSVRILQAELAFAEGRWTEALALMETIAATLLRRGRRWVWASALQKWAEVHVRRDAPADLERAQALLREAQAAFTEMGSQAYATLCDERLEALRREAYARAAAHDKVAQELAVARRIQEGLLPEEIPALPGWQLAVALEPARETSGDFYDFVALPHGRLGIVIADVADKGAGAALYMALSRTLIRTYAMQYPTRPEQALSMVNKRILAETHTGMFVTVFYGILAQDDGSLHYCNAGHHPPVLVGSDPSKLGSVQWLGRTGMALGVVDDTAWDQGVAWLGRGESLVLYTDGVTDAQGPDGSAFGQERLLSSAQEHLGTSAQRMQQALLAEIHGFMQDCPQYDDLTLMVLARS